MPHDITYTWNLNYDTNKQKDTSQTWRTNFGCQGGRRMEEGGIENRD